MGSKSKNQDKTETNTKTTVIDRRAVQQQGTQILDSLIVGADDKVVKAALAEMRASLDNMTNRNTMTVETLAGMVERILTLANKGQVEITRFGQEALEGARRDLRALQDAGQFIVKLADSSTGRAMTMAEQVARDQAENNRLALEIIADTKTGDFTDNLNSLSALIMAFALAALYITKRG